MKKVSLYRFLIIEALFTCFQGLVHPITPTLFKNLNFPDYIFGVVFAATSLGMFLFSPLWGKIGDKIGHSRAFSIALPIYALSQLGFGLSSSPIMAIVTRFFSGLSGGGAMVTALAYVINATNNDNRGKIMSYYAAFNAVSISMGFFIGGIVGNYSIKAVFIIQVFALLLGSILTVIFIKDPVVEEYSYIETTPFSMVIFNDKISKALVFMLITVFLTSMASTSFDNSFNYYIKDFLNLPSTYNGVIKAITGIVGLIVNFTVNLYLVKNTDLKKSVIIILMLCGLFSFAAPLFNNNNIFFLCCMIYYMFNSIYLPIQQVLVMENSDENSCGVISGIFNSVKSVGMIFGSLCVGFLYSIESKLPFIVTSIAFIIGAGVCLFNYIRIRKLEKI